MPSRVSFGSWMKTLPIRMDIPGSWQERRCYSDQIKIFGGCTATVPFPMIWLALQAHSALPLMAHLLSSRLWTAVLKNPSYHKPRLRYRLHCFLWTFFSGFVEGPQTVEGRSSLEEELFALLQPGEQRTWRLEGGQSALLAGNPGWMHGIGRKDCALSF